MNFQFRFDLKAYMVCACRPKFAGAGKVRLLYAVCDCSIC